MAINDMPKCENVIEVVIAFMKLALYTCKCGAPP